MSAVETVAALITPLLFCHIMIFYIMFELILNGIAEVLCFADRRFYDDWWNSTTWDEVTLPLPHTIIRCLAYLLSLSLVCVCGVCVCVCVFYATSTPANGTSQCTSGCCVTSTWSRSTPTRHRACVPPSSPSSCPPSYVSS